MLLYTWYLNNGEKNSPRRERLPNITIHALGGESGGWEQVSCASSLPCQDLGWPTQCVGYGVGVLLFCSATV